jgi:hypothetical protein
MTFQPRGSSPVGSAVGVLAAVDFDYQSMLRAREIDYIGVDWVLPAELVFLQAPISQSCPQSLLGFGCGLSEPAGLLI